MNREKLAGMLDHTLLSPIATETDIERLGHETEKYKFASAVVHPYWVDFLRDKFPNIKITEVINFPLGLSVSQVYTFAQINEQANEYDMVLNLAKVKEKKFIELRDEIKAVKSVIGKKILKVIIETALLTREEILLVVSLLTDCNVEYVKTSTGSVIQSEEKLLDQVAIINSFIKYHNLPIKVKASGGIKSYELVKILLGLGVDRIGTSNSIKILQEFDRTL